MVTVASLRDVQPFWKHGTKCKCIIVDAETLAKAPEAGPDLGSFDPTQFADNVFIYGFWPNTRHNTILRRYSAGALVSVAAPNAGTPFNVDATSREWCGQFAGLSFGSEDPAHDWGFVPGREQTAQRTLIRIGASPFLVRTRSGESQIVLASCSALADMDEVPGRGVSLLRWFSRLVPLMMFLRGTLGTRVWHNENPMACIVIDDPLLRTRHGFLEYRRLMESMGRLKFTTSLAFIPWNYHRSDPDVAKLFSADQYSPRLSVHGCDHTRAEFADTDGKALYGKARLALERMREHERLYGVPFDDVMVFPQGLFSVEAMEALREAGFLAVVNSDSLPNTASEVLTLRDLLDVAVTKWSGFPLFSRRYPRNIAEFAFDLFLGKPALAVEHHGYFRDGQGALETFVGAVNQLDDKLEWMNIGAICTCASLTRSVHESEVQVRFYSNRFPFANGGTDTRHYLLLHRFEGSLSAVTVDGQPCRYELAGKDLQIRLSLTQGQSADVAVVRPAETGATWRGSLTHDFGVRIRRWLCEFRDNHVHTNEILNAMMLTARSLSRTQPPSFGAPGAAVE